MLECPDIVAVRFVMLQTEERTAGGDALGVIQYHGDRSFDAARGADRTTVAAGNNKTPGKFIGSQAGKQKTIPAAKKIRDQVAQTKSDQTKTDPVAETVPVIGGKEIEPVKNKHGRYSYGYGLFRGIMWSGWAIFLLFTIICFLKKANTRR